MKIALVQLNPTVAAVAHNVDKMTAAASDAIQAGADLLVFPEQAILGYPAKDLLLRRDVIAANLNALNDFAAGLPGTVAAIVGFAEPNTAASGRPLSNAAAFIANGVVQTVYRKRLLPTYDVFDESRYFQPAGPQPLITLGKQRLGVSICEDLLAERMDGKPLYDVDPLAEQVAAGADLLINISASPFVIGKQRWREALMCSYARRLGRSICYVNQVGGNDELLFDGASCVVNAAGEVCARAVSFAEDVLVVDLEHLDTPPQHEHLVGPACIRAALVMGLRDYVRKCGFERVVVGLSGGIDSAVTAAIAAEALGAGQVHGVAMPSRFSSDHSVADARRLAQNLGIAFSIIPIEPMHAAFEAQLCETFADSEPGIAEENIQARCRGVTLMALSNKFGGLVLSTGNKSELAVGYTTLYGDMAGGLALISDVPKTMVYALAEAINRSAGAELIPRNTIEKPPSAELKPDQTDQDTLPSYDVLDAILERYEERLMSVDEIVADGFDRATVEQMTRLIARSEYKRQQAAPGLKITSKAFGFGRRMPIAAQR